MIVIRMQSTAALAAVKELLHQENQGQHLVHVMHNGAVTGVLERLTPVLQQRCQQLPGVISVTQVSVPYPLVSRQYQPHTSQIQIGNVGIGDGAAAIVAGPCSVESETQMFTAAKAAKKAGAHILRGGAYKPRTNPYSFQGLGVEGLQLLRSAGDSVGMPVVSEVMSPEAVETVSMYVDVLQIGTRNMANFDLLRAVGQSSRPVILKRGMAATVDEWLQAAEYIVATGNPNVILCERGIRSFDTSTRNTLDLAGAVLASQRSHLPVMVDPSHGTGVVELIGAMSMAAVAAGVHGLCLEMHPQPSEALSDGDQALTPEQLQHIIKQVTELARHLMAAPAADSVAAVR